MSEWKSRALAAAAVVVAAAGILAVAQAGSAGMDDERKKAQKELNDGNYRDAYDRFLALALDKDADPRMVGADLTSGVACLQNLNLHKDVDGFVKKVLDAHPGNWRLMQAAARIYYYQVLHYGSIVGGDFERGYHRGGGRWVYSTERDRVEALRLLDAALPFLEKDGQSVPGDEAYQFYVDMAAVLLGYRGYSESWRLLYLTDLKELPDYEENYYYGGGENRGAPVDDEGNPVFHKIPADYASAATDGERWRYLLSMAGKSYPQYDSTLRRQYADFLNQQFGVQTLAYYGGYFAGEVDDEEKGKTESGIWEFHTLADDETIARLASGVKRFRLPQDADFIAIYKNLEAWDVLANIYENRHQYDKAVECWKKSSYPDRVEQILGNWGQFEPTGVHPAGQAPSVSYRFRNGSLVEFDAVEVDVARLLTDVREYIKSRPKELDWDKANVENIGYRLVNGKGGKRYLLKKAAEWSMELKPRPNHFDRLVTVQPPLTKAGAYLVTARMKGGNISRIIVWIDNTVLVKKTLANKIWYYVADAVTGKPLPGMKTEFFGYWQEYKERWGAGGYLGYYYKWHIDEFSRKTDADGQVFLSPSEQSTQYTWMVIASDREGRLAYLGYTGIWYGDYYDYEYNSTRVYTITDRPVYRPGQTVKFKFWVRQAQYDQEDTSSYAGQTFSVLIHNPQGEKILEKNFTADKYGGFDGLLELPKDAGLGVWSLYVSGYGGSSFRVEEYKKPEFEVQVDAPTEPVALGEKIVAKVKAKYYFGAPVTQAKVKYKVERSDYAARWYPVGLWDWFYGLGYWWFAYDYDWYPGWHYWGCRRPVWWWWPTSYTPPELVAQNEVPIGPEGDLEIPIDTALAKEMHGDQDHQYSITVEVTDASRRTIVGQGTVLVARNPFKVYAWVDRGHYRTGDTVQADFRAQTLDSKPVKGTGEATLFSIRYEGGKPVETAVESWSLPTDDQGSAMLQIKASEPGQFRLSYKVTDSKSHTLEGGYIFVVTGEAFDGAQFRFNDIELVPDRREYAPGDKVKLQVNINKEGGTVLLFVRPANGIYLPPKVLRLQGKSTIEEIEVIKKDMPNFFVEAVTIADGKLHSDMREIVVPPEKRVLNVEITAAEKYKPGEKARVRIKLSDLAGKPFQGSAVLAVYDKAVEYISGGSNVPEIREFFWKWRRSHSPSTECSFNRWFGNLLRDSEVGMATLGVFGGYVATMDYSFADDALDGEYRNGKDSPAVAAPAKAANGGGGLLEGRSMARSAGAKMKMAEAEEASKSEVAADKRDQSRESAAQPGPGGSAGPEAEATVRQEFADTAFWAADLQTGPDGTAEVEFTMPENLTGWKFRTWGMGHGTKVGEGTTMAVTVKNLLLRLQAPRFFVEKDEVVLSANVHNYLATPKKVRVVLELDGNVIESIEPLERFVEVASNGEARVDWRVKVISEGEAVVRMKALTDEESDAMQMRFPAYVHGMLKTESFSGVVRPEQSSGSVMFTVPAERRADQSRIEARYSPTLAAAMVDALPYLADYPYGCTEQTLNRFLPAAITQNTLKRMGVKLEDIEKKLTNLNAQEIGDDKERARQWKRYDRSPVFEEKVLNDMVRTGVARLTGMQLSDGGWGWFSGWGEYSYPHTTAYVVHGLQIARANGVKVRDDVLQRGVEWLDRYQSEQVAMLKNAPKQTHPWKEKADELDAFVYMVLADADRMDKDMRDFLYRDRTTLAVYAKAMFGLALLKQKETEKLHMIMRNLDQFVVEDPENQSAWLNLGSEGYWWYWYGSEYEAHAYYLKLMSAVDPKNTKASGVVKYLLNNRRHATYWNSTRDTALCVEAFADYLAATGEDKPDMTIEVLLDGKMVKEVKVDSENLFTFDNKLVVEGREVTSGKHTLELRRKGKGPIYFNAYVTNFTLEDYITKAGLEVKVNRKYYKLVQVDKSTHVRGSKGQAVSQKVEKFERQEIPDLTMLKSGQLVEVELLIESKNDYEYLVFEDMKPAGFEPVEVRSGYNGNDMGAYVEFRDERVAFFVRALARGKHSVAYRMRAEIPGRFSALPTRAHAMYAPELKANSDEIKLQVED